VVACTRQAVLSTRGEQTKLHASLNQDFCSLASNYFMWSTTILIFTCVATHVVATISFLITLKGHISRKLAMILNQK
jgi:hypothetical protein